MTVNNQYSYPDKKGYSREGPFVYKDINAKKNSIRVEGFPRITDPFAFHYPFVFTDKMAFFSRLFTF